MDSQELRALADDMERLLTTKPLPPEAKRNLLERYKKYLSAMSGNAQDLIDLSVEHEAYFDFDEDD